MFGISYFGYTCLGDEFLEQCGLGVPFVGLKHTLCPFFIEFLEYLHRVGNLVKVRLIGLEVGLTGGVFFLRMRLCGVGGAGIDGGRGGGLSVGLHD
jgi:hypothetical protein